MISLSATSAILLYFVFASLTLFLVWAAHKLSDKKKKPITPSQQLQHCEYCQSPYLALTNQKVSKCPRCDAYNGKG